MTGVIWKQIPLYTKYEVSNTGLIREIATGELRSIYEGSTSNGTYLYVSVFSDVRGKRRQLFVHRAVCKAFHGLHPDYAKLDVNHKDTDKHNNHDWNLEWSTRSANVKHSFMSGTRNDALQVIMTDHETGEETKFWSMKELAEWLGLKHKKGFHHAMRYRTVKYQGRYTFRVEGVYIAPERNNAIATHLIDFVNHEYHRFINLGQMEIVKDIRRGTAQTLLNAPELRLFNGCVIAKVGDERLFEYVPTVTQVMIDQSVADYQKHSAVERRPYDIGFLVKDYTTGVISTLTRTSEVNKLLDITSIVSSYSAVKLRLFRGVAVKRSDDADDFLDYTPEYIQLSLKHQPLRGIPIRVTNLISNTTEDWPGLAAFAKSIGVADIEGYRQKVKYGSIEDYKFEDLQILN